MACHESVRLGEREEIVPIFFPQPHRISKYEPFEDIVNPKAVLKKWDSPPLSEINRHVKDIKDLHDVQSVKLRSIAIRMKRQE